MNPIFTLAAAAMTLLVVAPTATAVDLPPLVGWCVDGVRDCRGSDMACVVFSYQVPQCVAEPEIVCTEICDPCTTLECEPAGSEPMCMYYYYEIDTGIVRYVQRDSCHSEVYVDGERVK